MAITVCVYEGTPSVTDLQQATVVWTPPVDLLCPEHTPLLFGIDEYDDTVFNALQAQRQLPSEIAYLRRHLHDPEQLAMLDELDRLIGLAGSRTGRHLWFIGD